MKKNEEQLLETENSSITIEQLDETSLDTITGGQLSGYTIKPTTFKEHLRLGSSEDFPDGSTGGGSRTKTYKPSPK